MPENIEMMTKELPMNFGPLHGANANARITGPCGDTMEFWLKIDNNQIVTATFTTDGCENSIICGSSAGYMVQSESPRAYARGITCFGLCPPEFSLLNSGILHPPANAGGFK